MTKVAINDVPADSVVMIAIKDLYEITDFIIAFGVGLDRSLKDDGALTVKDLPNLLPLLLKVVPALEGVDGIPIALKAMDKEDGDKYYAHIKDQLGDISDEETQAFIEDSLRVVLDLWIVLNKYFFKAVPTGDSSKSETKTQDEGMSQSGTV